MHHQSFRRPHGSRPGLFREGTSRIVQACLPALLDARDLLVFNDTQVVKARLFGEKPTGGKLELLIERVLDGRDVAAHMKVSKKPPVGTVLRMAGGFAAELLGRWPDAEGALFHLRLSGDAYALMAAHGHVPLPPYISHGDNAEDEARYQTVFARHPGAVAAARRSRLDIGQQAPRRLSELPGAETLVVTVCDQAHEELVPPDTWLHWSIPDPVPTGTAEAFDATVTELRSRVTRLHGGGFER